MREDLSDFEEDDEPVIEATKEKKKKETKTLVFEIKLAEDVNEKYEYNYKEMVKEHEERMKKVDSDIEIIEILDDDPVPKKKKYKKPVKVDPEDEYDLDDDFIDDTEANDEVVPDQVSTEHGGFYINIGRLKYVELNSGSTGTGDGSKAGCGDVPGGTSAHGSSIISARRTPTQAGGRRTVGGPSTSIRSQTSIRNFLGKEGPHRQGKTLPRSPGGK